MTTDPPTPTLPPPSIPTPAEVAERRARWTTALRSGDFAQGYGALRVVDDLTPDDEPRIHTYCCLGVAEKIRNATWDDEHRVVSTAVNVTDDGYELLTHVTHEGGTLSGHGMVWLGLKQSSPYVAWFTGESWHVSDLASLNDEERLPFNKIADVIDYQGADWDGTSRYAVALKRARHEAGAVPPLTEEYTA